MQLFTVCLGRTMPQGSMLMYRSAICLVSAAVGYCWQGLKERRGSGWQGVCILCTSVCQELVLYALQVIALLNTCGSYFSKGAAKRRLDRFLTFLQAYVAAKQQLPLDVDADLQVGALRAGCGTA